MNRVLKFQEKNLRIYQIIKSAVPHKVSKRNEDFFAVINIYKFVLHLYLKRTTMAQLTWKKLWILDLTSTCIMIWINMAPKKLLRNKYINWSSFRYGNISQFLKTSDSHKMDRSHKSGHCLCNEPKKGRSTEQGFSKEVFLQ